MELHKFTCQLICILIAFCSSFVRAQSDEDGTNSNERFKIEGVVLRPENSKLDSSWFANTRIHTNTGHVAFLRENGSFVLHNLAWGHHYINVLSPNTAYLPVRIDISPRGKWRARRVNILQPSKVEMLSLPLKIAPQGPIHYFQMREQWRLMDMLFNPMVLMTVLPLGLLLLVPKFSDPETRKEVEAQLQMPKPETPDLSEFMTNLFKGGPAAGSSERRSTGRGGGVAGISRGGRRK